MATKAVFQPPPMGAPIVRPQPGGVRGKPPGGFVYPHWLPQIPGTIVAAPRVVEPPHECPDAPIQSTTTSAYYGSGYDDSISHKKVSGKSLRDCELKYCHIENATLVDCLLIGCTVNNGSLTDVELRSTRVHKATVHDVKASGSKFGLCKVSEADATGCNLYQCDVTSSELKQCSAWQTKVSDATIKAMRAYSGCSFSDCGGDVPKVPDAPSAAEGSSGVSGSGGGGVPPYEGDLPKSVDCPTARFARPGGMPAYSGKACDDAIKGQAVVGRELVDCKVEDCFIDDSKLTDCLVINCVGNGGVWKDVELRGTSLYSTSLDDVKAIAKCRFGECTIVEGDLQNSHYNRCTVTSCEVVNGIAWDTRFRDASIRHVQLEGKCKFALCAGDVPKKQYSDEEGDDEEMANLPPPYTPAEADRGGVGPSSSGAMAPSYSAAPLSREGSGAVTNHRGDAPAPAPAAAAGAAASGGVGMYTTPQFQTVPSRPTDAGAGGYTMPTYGSGVL